VWCSSSRRGHPGCLRLHRRGGGEQRRPVIAGTLDQHLSRAPHGRHSRAELGSLPHGPRGDLLRPHHAQVVPRLVALVSDVVKHHIHGAADDDLAFNPGHAISCAPDLLPSDPAVGTTGRGKGPRPTSPRHARARTGTGAQGRATAARHARFLHPAAQPTAPISRRLPAQSGARGHSAVRCLSALSIGWAGRRWFPASAVLPTALTVEECVLDGG